MKKFIIALLSFFGVCQAQESISVQENYVFAVSSFDAVDYFSTLTKEGEYLWEIPFSTQVQSFEVKDDQLFILSKTRNGLAYFVTCVNKEDGKVIWEKGIYAPENEPLTTLTQD